MKRGNETSVPDSTFGEHAPSDERAASGNCVPSGKHAAASADVMPDDRATAHAESVPSQSPSHAVGQLPNEYIRINLQGTIVDESWGAASLLDSSQRTLTGIPLARLATFSAPSGDEIANVVSYLTSQVTSTDTPALQLQNHSGQSLSVTRVAFAAPVDELEFLTLWFVSQTAGRVEVSEDVHLLEMASRMSQVGGWELVKASQRVRWTPQTFRLHDLDVGDPPSLEDALNYYLPEDRRILQQAIECSLSEGTPFELELRMITATGKLRYTRSLGRPVFVDGQVVSLQGTFQDVTEERLTQIALQESEARYRDIFENNNAIKLIIDPDSGRIVEANSAAMQFYGYSRDELCRMKILDINVDPPELVREKLEAVRDNLLAELEFRHRLANGEIRNVKVHTGAVHVNGQKLVHSIIFDITDRKRAERYVQRMQHLESLGRLAGGIAHDFNNVLTIIFGNLSLAQLSLPDDSGATEYLANAEHAIGRAKGLSRQLLTFAKGGAPICQSVSLAELVTEVTGFDLSGSNVRREMQFAPDLHDVHVDPAQLEQVISNLTLNADEAMPHGGTLRVTARNRVVSESDVVDTKAGEYVELLLEDEGCGVPADNLQRIFEPYFSTKPNGTGLGLATCYSIVSRHQGLLTVESTEGQGTVFSVLLPAATAADDGAQDQRPTAVNSEAALRRVLVLDDERMILDVVRGMLAQDGIEVDAFERTDDAVDAFRRQFAAGQPYDLVILDLTIPGGPGGREAVARILEIDAEACAICSSGYADDHVMANFQEYGFRGVIAKPYVGAELRQLVRSYHRRRST